MAVPARTLVAACRWLELLRGSPYAQAKSLLWNNPHYQDLSRNQYDQGLALLNELGLYIADEGIRPDLKWASDEQLRIIFAADVVAHSAPAWLEEPVLEDAIADPPKDAMETLAWLKLGEDCAPEVIRRAYGKVDLERRTQVGAAGELALMELLLASGVDSVEQVSAYDDGAGFDLRVFVNEMEYHLEVKTTSKMRSLRIFLSRNEYEVSTRDSKWRLVTVGLDTSLRVASLATVESTAIRQNVPLDRKPVGRWSNCQLNLSNHHLSRGLHLGEIHLQTSSSEKWWP